MENHGKLWKKNMVPLCNLCTTCRYLIRKKRNQCNPGVLNLASPVFGDIQEEWWPRASLDPSVRSKSTRQQWRFELGRTCRDGFCSGNTGRIPELFVSMLHIYIDARSCVLECNTRAVFLVVQWRLGWSRVGHAFISTWALGMEDCGTHL